MASRRCCSPSPTRSRTSSSGSSRRRRCSPAASARTRPAPCCCRDAGRDADAALAAAPAVGRPARRRLALRLVPDPRRDLPRVPVGRLRPAGAARDPGRRRPSRDRDPRRRDGARLAVRGQPHVRLRRGLHVRRRHADRRATGRRADARPRPAARAARPGGAARAARPGRAGRPRAEPPGADRRPAGDDARRRPRPAAAAGRPVDGRGGRPDRGWPGGRRPWLAELDACPAGGPDPDRAARIAGWRSRTSPATATGSGIAPPVGVPAAFLGPAVGALDGLLARWARTHGPFLTPEPARRWGLPVGVVEDALERLLGAGTLLRGEFRPGGAEREWCDPEVLRLLRRRSLARLRREVEPVDPAALGAVPARLAGRRPGRCGGATGRRCAARPPWSASPRSSTSWPGCRSRRRSSSGTCCRPGSRATSRACSTSSARSARSPGWGGGASAATTAGSRSSGPGARSCDRSGSPDGVEPPAEPRHVAIREHLAARGASFYRELFAAARGTSDREVLDALWDLVWAGEVTNDTFAPLRALRWKRTRERRAGGQRPAGAG